MDSQNNCQWCGNHLSFIWGYKQPDKYERYCKIMDIDRKWLRCKHCGWIESQRNYDPNELDDIYVYGYRDKDFRGEDIQETFSKIYSMPYVTSENKVRLDWFLTHSKLTHWDVLDIGSGIGVWPQLLSEKGCNVFCVEPNKYSSDFIKYTLGLPCYTGFFDKSVTGEYDLISLVHVLEHIEKPVKALKNIAKRLRPSGEIFIEVPDSVEFEYLGKEHDEFNSCHRVFYNFKTLAWTMEKAGLCVMDIHSQHYPERHLTRIMAIGKNETH